MAKEQSKQQPPRERVKIQLPVVTLSPDFTKGFLEGMVAITAILVLLIVWANFRAENTLTKIESNMAFETIPITEETTPPKASVKKSAPILTLAERKQQSPLPPAPLEGLEEPYGNATLPITRVVDDLSPFDAYRRPFTPQVGKPMVAIGIVDFGLSARMSQSVLDKLPADVTLILSPYAPDLKTWAVAARAYGHEFWLGLPMQRTDFDSNPPGPHTLLLSSALDENKNRLFAVMGDVSGYAGLVTEKNHGFAGMAGETDAILKQIFGRGLALAESNPQIQAYGLPMAMEFNYPYVQNHFWIDENLRPEDINQTLKNLELLALQKGKAVGFVHPYPLAVQALQEWMNGAAERGIQIVPLSALAMPSQ